MTLDEARYVIAHREMYDDRTIAYARLVLERYGEDDR